LLAPAVRIIPVLDLKGGLVVRGIGGRRDEYRPVVSGLVSSAEPLDVARAFRDRFHVAEVYVADLDAIAGASPRSDIYAALEGLGLRLWVDAGVRDAAQACQLARAGIDTLVVGLETIRGKAALAAAYEAIGPERLVFSLDLKAGEVLGDPKEWPERDPWSVAAAAVAIGIRRLLVLDLAQVGTGGGTATEDLCRRLAQTHPNVELATGGGVRGPDDIRRLRDAGVRAVLVASALHDGRLKPEDLPGL
jgi:phosphoribosylformimino-5-aminoimidazole carboxamide ribotide isomerase